MKKLLFIIIIFASAMMGGAQVPCWDGTIADAYAGGDGTYENPYQIATPEQLALLAEQTNTGNGGDAYYLLTEDLCLNGSQNNHWEPIGNASAPFMGWFNGNGHTVSDMYMTNQVYSGLFGFTLGADIKDPCILLFSFNITLGAFSFHRHLGKHTFNESIFHNNYTVSYFIISLSRNV